MNWKEFLIAMGSNIAVGILLSLNCEGERCMIIIMAFFYCVIAFFAYLTYFAFPKFKEIGKQRILAYCFPSIVMFIAIFAWLKFGSNIPLGQHNLTSIFLAVLPNTILQLAMFVYSLKKN